jgi:hypothetical protein
MQTFKISQNVHKVEFFKNPKAQGPRLVSHSIGCIEALHNELAHLHEL